MKEIELFDVEQQKNLTISVTETDYLEIVENQNLTLATTLYKKQQKKIREKENFVAAFNLLQNSSKVPSTSTHVASYASTSKALSSPSTTSASNMYEMENLEENLEESTGSISEYSEITKLWTDDSIKYLIHLCKKFARDFSTGVKKFIWNKISKGLSEKFHQLYTSQQCDTKWKGLKNTYKTIKKHNDQSGNSYKFWKFFDLMDEVLFSKPEINATATCSRARGLVLRNVNTESNTEQHSDNDNSNEDTKANDNTPKNYTSLFTKKRKSTENAIERRHQEKMARQDRFLDLIGRLTTAVEASVSQNLGNN